MQDFRNASFPLNFYFTHFRVRNTESDHQRDNPFGVKQGQGQILKFMSHTSGGRADRRSGLPVRPVVPIIHFLDMKVLKFTRARFGFTIIY